MKSEWFLLWLKSCKEFGQNVRMIEKDGEDTGVWVTNKRYIWGEYNPHCEPLDRWHYYYTDPYYHVWVNGKEIDVIKDDYKAALALYHKELERTQREEQKATDGS